MANTTTTTTTTTTTKPASKSLPSTTLSSESGNFTTPEPFFTTDSDNSTSANTTWDVTTVDEVPEGVEPYVIALPVVFGILFVILAIGIALFLRRHGRKRREKITASKSRPMPPSKEELRQREMMRRDVSVSPSYIEFIEEDPAAKTPDISPQENYINVQIPNGRPLDKDTSNDSPTTASVYENVTPKSKQRTEKLKIPIKNLKPLKLKLPPKPKPKPEPIQEESTPGVYIEMNKDRFQNNKQVPDIPALDTYEYTEFVPPRDYNSVPADILSQVPTVEGNVGPAPCPSHAGYYNVPNNGSDDTHIDYETVPPSPSDIYVNTNGGTR